MTVGVLILRKMKDGSLMSPGPFPDEVAWSISTLEKLGWEPPEEVIVVPTPNGEPVLYQVLGAVTIRGKQGVAQAVTSRRLAWDQPFEWDISMTTGLNFDAEQERLFDAEPYDEEYDDEEGEE